jgi:hypothetical protein
LIQKLHTAFAKQLFLRVQALGVFERVIALQLCVRPSELRQCEANIA